MEPADHLRALREGADSLLDVARGNLDAPVPSCPGWDLAELLVHVGLAWSWATNVVESGQRSDAGQPPEDRSEGPLLTWAQERAERLLTTLGAADPDSNCWTFGLPRTTRFWIRRQALETAMHTWDAQQAAGKPSPIEPSVACDGVDEYLHVMVPRWVARHPEGWTGQSVHLHRTDGDGEWLVRLGPEGDVSTERAHGKGDVAIRGNAEALWLWCCNRAGIDALDLEVFGDRSIADRWTSEITF